MQRVCTSPVVHYEQTVRPRRQPPRAIHPQVPRRVHLIHICGVMDVHPRTDQVVLGGAAEPGLADIARHVTRCDMVIMSRR